MNSGEDFRLPGDSAARHARLLADFLANEKPSAFTHPDMFSKSGVLPLTGDWGGCTGIRADGEIVFFLWDNPDDVRIETDSRLRNMAIFQGAQKFPELAMLIPSRPADAVTCGHCNGSGVLPEFPEIKNIVCSCGGLGWLPPGTPPTA